MIDTLITWQAASFVVNTAVTSVNCTATAARMQQSGTKSFRPNDNFIIRSIGISLPHSFCSGPTPLSLAMDGIDNVPASFVITELGGGVFFFPAENTEVQVDKEVSYENYVSHLQWMLRCAVGGTVSMVSVPAVLNGVTLYVAAYAKIEHTLALV